MDLVQVFQPNIGSMGWGKPLVSLVGLFTLVTCHYHKCREDPRR